MAPRIDADRVRDLALELPDTARSLVPRSR
jgi:hypothetical protein